MNDPAPDIQQTVAHHHARLRRIQNTSALFGLACSLAIIDLTFFASNPPGRDETAGLVFALTLTPVIAMLFVTTLISARWRGPVVSTVLLLGAGWLLLLVFALGYLLMFRSFTGLHGHVDALYFAATVLTTTGFGDIAPQSAAARLLVTAQMLYDMLFLAGVLAVAVKPIADLWGRQEHP